MKLKLTFMQWLNLINRKPTRVGDYYVSLKDINLKEINLRFENVKYLN